MLHRNLTLHGDLYLQCEIQETGVLSPWALKKLSAQVKAGCPLASV